MDYKIIVALCLLIAVSGVNSANILFLTGIPSPSHHIWNRALVYGVAASGEHNITVVSSDIEKAPPSNVHFIHLEKMYDTLYSEEDSMDIFEMANVNALQAVLTFDEFAHFYCRGILASRGLYALLDYPDNFKFDLVVHDITAGPCLLLVMDKFKNTPLIGVTAFMNPPYSTFSVGGHKYPAYIPHYTLGYTTDMHLGQRLLNFILYFWDAFSRKYVTEPKIDKMIKDKLGDNAPNVAEWESKHRMLFVNTHPSIEAPEPLPPNIIPVGGLQLKITPDELPTDFKEFIESSQKGAVLFSLGTNVRSDQLKIETQTAFINAFAQMPQYNFIWKFESTQNIPLPKNVIIRPWVPQSDMLAHPKVVGFISHSGALSTHESMYHGKPIISVPVFADQHHNSFKVVLAGVGEKIDFKTVTAKTAKETILKVLETPSYTTKIKAISRAFQDQKETPLERAVWWIEWSLRNPEADYMLSPTQKLGYFSSNCYDVLLILLGVPFLIFVFIVKYIKCKFISKKCNSKELKDKKHK